MILLQLFFILITQFVKFILVIFRSNYLLYQPQHNKRWFLEDLVFTDAKEFQVQNVDFP